MQTKSIALGNSKVSMLGMLDDQRFTRSHRCKVTRKKVSTILMSYGTSNEVLAEGKELLIPLFKVFMCNAVYSSSLPFLPQIISKVEWHGGKGHLDDQENLNHLRI